VEPDAICYSAEAIRLLIQSCSSGSKNGHGIVSEGRKKMRIVFMVEHNGSLMNNTFQGRQVEVQNAS
jgi:hypothetical protein